MGTRNERFHFGGREFLANEVNQLKLETINKEANFHIKEPVVGFELPDGTILVNGGPLSGAICASIRSHFNATQNYYRGTWVFIPDVEEEEEEDGRNTG